MHARTMENTNRRRNAPTEAAARPRTRYSSFTADHGQAARPGRRVGGETGEPAARSAQRISTGRAISTATNTEGDHAAGAYPPGHRPRRSDPRPAARFAPAARRLLDVDHGDRRRVVSWTLTTATGGDQRQRPALSFIGISPRRADTLKEALNKIIKTTEKGHYRRNGNLLNLLLFLRFILLTFLDINISL